MGWREIDYMSRNRTQSGLFCMHYNFCMVPVGLGTQRIQQHADTAVHLSQPRDRIPALRLC